ncbi:GH92 family glycosyl hydrolase [Agaribacter flavus]|uniref:GH92 family glycosyl hydrolase n=1 Tax=Agaribacter flavus TaxID=1902781 RepID=A0ABV7FQ33_9ALTE
MHGRFGLSYLLKVSVVGLVSATILSCSSLQREVTEVLHTETHSSDVLDYVDPFIGTGGHGHTFPGATAPFGMVQLSPDNPSKGWDWTSGYHYSDNVLLGFSHTHLSGTGVGDLLDVLVMPFQGNYLQTIAQQDNSVFTEYTKNVPLIYDTYAKENEQAQAGYYQVSLDKSGIRAELTASERVGVHRYHFDYKKEAKLIFNLGYAQNYDEATETSFSKISDTKLVGYRRSTGWAKRQTVYFVAEFNHPFSHQYFENKEPKLGDKHQGILSEAVLNFGELADELVVKVGISYASIAGAQANIDLEVPHFDFEKVKNEVQQTWREQLNIFEIDSVQSLEKKTKFYTAFYHSMIAPHLYSDALGQFTGGDGKLYTTNKALPRYTLFSLWDTFRTLHPLLTITHPKLIDPMMHSMYGFYEETRLLPTWDLMANETDVMIGYHAVPVLVDAYFKGLTTLKPEQILSASKASAMQDMFGIDHFKQYGYIPSELEVEAVSKTLEYAFDDWAIAKLAASIAAEDDAAYFADRASAYKTLFDKELQFMRGKDQNGKWVEPFNPTHVEHRNTDYTEANAWQYTWFVPHDVEGLIALFGGNVPFVNKLDELFTTSSEMHGDDVSPDISGLIGQYAHGNEPVHHVPYLYALAGSPEKGEQRIRQIRDTMYTSQADGLAGNDDVGQMSAWYVMSALGFYPLNPASGEYVLGVPDFERIFLYLGSKKLEIKVQGELTSPVKRIEFNGEQINNHKITHFELLKGGVLTFITE